MLTWFKKALCVKLLPCCIHYYISAVINRDEDFYFYPECERHVRRLCVKIERLRERTERKTERERERERHLSFELDADKFVINYGAGKLDLAASLASSSRLNPRDIDRPIGGRSRRCVEIKSHFHCWLTVD